MKTIENIHISVLFNDGSQESGNLNLSDLSKFLVAGAIDNDPNTKLLEYLRLVFELGIRHPLHKKVLAETPADIPDKEGFVPAEMPMELSDQGQKLPEPIFNIPATLQSILKTTGARK